MIMKDDAIKKNDSDSLKFKRRVKQFVEKQTNNIHGVVNTCV